MRRTSTDSSRFSFPMPRMGRRVLRRGFQPAVSRLEDRTLLATVTWINPNSGDWDTPSNWSTGALPAPSDVPTPGRASGDPQPSRPSLDHRRSGLLSTLTHRKKS